MKTKADYLALEKRLNDLSEKADKGWMFSLSDPCVDRENVLVGGMTEDSEQFWTNMYWAAIDAANIRAAEYGVVLPADLQN